MRENLADRMARGVRVLCGSVALLLGVAAAAAVPLVLRGLSARDPPTWAETVLARALRRLATPAALRGAANPLPATPELLARARAHFADHCASCHGNDGRGDTALGRSLYPPAPDMTLEATQGLSDGELFAIIENGVRLTGMPAWGGTGPEDDAESWELVHFVRHLPQIREEELAEMEALNPKTRAELEEEERAHRFLEGGDAVAPPPAAH